MQLAVIEYARNVCGLTGATSAEFEPAATHKLIDIMSDQRDVTTKGGTMRLGAYPCVIKPGSVAERIYEKTEISERHRHRYEVNNTYREALEKAGLTLSWVASSTLSSRVVPLTGTRCLYISCGQRVNEKLLIRKPRAPKLPTSPRLHPARSALTR
jgi:CTP synthase